MDAVVAPVLHKYVVAGRFDVTETVDGSPKQMALLLALTVSTGFGKTVTVTAPVVTQPSGLVTVTLYVVVATGETVIEAVFPPLLQVKVLPAISLVAVRVELSPTQMLASEVETVITGSGFTMTVTAPVVIQPSGLVTVTLYVVVVTGETVVVAVFAPLLQANVLPGILLVVFKLVLSPTQISASVVVTEITGSGLTTI